MYEQPPLPPPLPPGRNRGLIIGLSIGAAALLLCLCGIGLVFLLAFNRFDSDPKNAKVGDCVTETVKQDASDAKVVACSKPEAKNKVVGIIPNVTESEFDRENQSLCDAYPDWEQVIWLGQDGGSGKALCLAPNKIASSR
jgi:hypothetical protein